MAGSAIQKIKGFHVFSAPNDADTVTPPSDFDKTIIGLAGEFMDLWLWAEGKQTQGSGEPLSLRDASAYGRTIAALAGGTASIVSTSGQLNGKPAILFDGTSDGAIQTQWCPTSSYFCVFALRNIAAPGEMRIMGQTGNSGLTRSDFRIHQSSATGQGLAQSGTIKHITGTGNSCANGTDHVGWFSYNASDDTIRGGWDNVDAELSDTIANAIDPINTVWRFGGSGSSANFFNGKFGSVIFLNTHLHDDADKDLLRQKLVSVIGAYYGVTIAGAVTVSNDYGTPTVIGTGVAPALAKNVGTTGSIVLRDGSLGSPSDFGAGVSAALANATNAASGIPTLTNYGRLSTALTRTIDARNFGVVGDPVTTARASLTDNTAALQSIITYVKSLTETTGLSSIQAEVPIMTIVDLPPGYVGVTVDSTPVWQIPPHSASNGYIDILAAVVIDCDNIVFRGNGTTIVHKDPGTLSGYAPAFATYADRDLVCGSDPIKTFSGLTRIEVTCTEPHRLEPDDVLLVGGTMTTANGVSASMISGYQRVAFTTLTAYKFSFYYTGTNASATGNIGGSDLTFTALRSVRNIGFIGDLTFSLTKPSVSSPQVDGIFLLGVNHSYIEATFRSEIFSGRLVGHGVQAYNCRFIQFGDKCAFTTIGQAIDFQYCSDIIIGDVTLRNVNEGIDFDHSCTNVRVGHLLGVFDNPFYGWPDASRTQQQRQLLDFSDIRHCYVASITALNYWEPIFCYSKNYWTYYHEWLENAGTVDNLNQPAFSDVTIGAINAASDETDFDDEYRAIMISWNQSSNINLVLGTDPFTTTNGSAVVACVVGEAHDFRVGDTVAFGGTIADFGGLVSGNISGARTIAAVTDTTHFTFTAGASATSGVTGGGSSVTATTPQKGIDDVPQPNKISIGSITMQHMGYLDITGADVHIGAITVDDPLGTGAPIRIDSSTVTLSGGGSLTMPAKLTCDAIRIKNAAGPALSLSGTYDSNIGSIDIDTAVASLSLSGNATSRATFGPIKISNDTGIAMSIGGSGSYAFGPINLTSCTTGMTISSSPLVRFSGPIHMPSTTTPVGSVSITARLAAHSYTVPLGAVVATASILDKPIFGLKTGEGAFIVQGWLSNVSAITGDGTNYATVQLINSSSSGAARIGDAPINYGNSAISAGAATALQGNGTDTDGRMSANQMVAFRFLKEGTGQTFPELIANLDAIRYTV